jgi:branched-subunit amino acid aminotransferase/4-amino-4-deoxychorismate lyase
MYKTGISCTLSKRFKKNEHSPLSQIKSLSFLENVFCRQQARLGGFEETIFSNTSGFLAEASVSNIFFVKKGVVFTPAVSCGIIPGIVRKIIFEISAESGIKIKEGKYSPSELKKSREVFITNTLIGVLPVTEIDNVKINDGKTGVLTKFFLKKFLMLTNPKMR